MALTQAAARTGMKRRLDIQASDTTFNAVIDQFVIDAIDRLAPTVYQEVDVQEVSVTVSSRGEATIDLSSLSTPIDDVRQIEASAGDGEWPIDNYQIHGTSCRMRELSGVSSVFIYGLVAYTRETLPNYLHLAVYYFALAEFYQFLMANKAKYNVFMQNGRPAVDNMQDLVDFYESKGHEVLDSKAAPYGR